jgi:peptidoglycan-associated lipoprotein
MRNILTLIFSIAIFGAAVAQPSAGRLTPKKRIALAEEQVAKFEYDNAIEQLEAAYEEDKDPEIAIFLGDLYMQTRDYKRAVMRYRSGLRKDKAKQFVEARFNYARAIRMNQDIEDIEEDDIEKAKSLLEDYKTLVTDEKKIELADAELKGCEFMMSAQDVDGRTVTHAGKKVNTKYSEYSAVWDPSGDLIYYARVVVDEEGKDKKDETKTLTSVKIYTAKRTEKGLAEPEVLGDHINTGKYTANISISRDGNRLYFTRQDLDGNGLVSSKIYISQKSGDGWGAAEEVNGINGEYLANYPAVGELYGKEVIFFSSNMEGGQGGWDIYYATYKGAGVYGDPVSLGPKINTPGDEVTPFYQDGILYFSSNGHVGVGGMDVFSSEWNGSRWSAPSNMGLGVNSSVDDKYYNITPDGYRGFFTSNRKGTGSKSVNSKTCCDDIYNVSYKIILANLEALVFDSETKEALSGSKMQILDMTSGAAVKFKNFSNTKANDFSSELELDRDYVLITSMADYVSDTMSLETVGLVDSRTWNENIMLDPMPIYITITKENPIKLQNIIYDFDDDKILEESEEDLQFILDLMNDYPEMRIELLSHTDSRGEDAYNYNLSQRRANSAKTWLVDRGIQKFRIEALGEGESKPFTVTDREAAEYDYLPVDQLLTDDFILGLETEDMQEAAFQLNRRSEFRITEGPTSIKIEEKKLTRKGVREVTEENK